MLVYYFVAFIVSNHYLLFWVSNGHNSVTVQNRTHVYTNFFHHKDLGNHLLQLCPRVVKHPVYTSAKLKATFLNAIDVFYSYIFLCYTKWCFVYLNERVKFTYFLHDRPIQRQKKLRLRLLCALYSVNKFTITLYTVCLMFSFYPF